jgi:hypothetical protein
MTTIGDVISEVVRSMLVQGLCFGFICIFMYELNITIKQGMLYGSARIAIISLAVTILALGEIIVAGEIGEEVENGVAGAIIPSFVIGIYGAKYIVDKYMPPELSWKNVVILEILFYILKSIIYNFYITVKN